MHGIALKLFSVLSLAACLTAPVLYFLGRVSFRDYRLLLLGATVAWFVCAAAIAFKRK